MDRVRGIGNASRMGPVIYISSFPYAQLKRSSHVGTERFWDLDAHIWEKAHIWITCGKQMQQV